MFSEMDIKVLVQIIKENKTLCLDIHGSDTHEAYVMKDINTQALMKLLNSPLTRHFILKRDKR